MGMRHPREERPPIHACLHDLEEKGSLDETRTRHDCNRQS